MMAAQTLVIGGSEQKPGFRRELCDGCGRGVWLPRGGQVDLDDAEDQERDSLVSCVGCSMRRIGQAMTVAILVAQGERWK